MALKRQIMQKLEAWKKNPRHRALLITGARQVGKTFIVREFARQQYESFLEINFVRTPRAADIFADDLDVESIIVGLTAFSGQPLIPGKTLVFLDEIQECPRARTAIKFLVDDGRYDYIESGSLLGVNCREVPSYPVGYEETVRMHPLTLEEFFIANGIQDEVFDFARTCVLEGKPVPEIVNERLLKLFRYYLAVGGMPAAVQEFVETSDLARVLVVQRDILTQYRQDIARYASNKMHVHAIFDAIPAELDKKNKRFKLSDLSKTARMERYGSDFMWLVDAGVALPCYNVTEPKAPLSINMQHNLFKLYLCDVGLLCAASTGAIQFDLIRGDTGINWGSILENALAQQLVANGFSLRYFDKPKIGEIDFLVQQGSRVVPVEAKSGKGYRKHAALNNLLAVKAWNLTQAYVLCSCNMDVREGITYAPWYAVAFLRQESLPQEFIVEPV